MKKRMLFLLVIVFIGFLTSCKRISIPITTSDLNYEWYDKNGVFDRVTLDENIIIAHQSSLILMDTSGNIINETDKYPMLRIIDKIDNAGVLILFTNEELQLNIGFYDINGSVRWTRSIENYEENKLIKYREHYYFIAFKKDGNYLLNLNELGDIQASKGPYKRIEYVYSYGEDSYFSCTTTNSSHIIKISAQGEELFSIPFQTNALRHFLVNEKGIFTVTYENNMFVLTKYNHSKVKLFSKGFQSNISILSNDPRYIYLMIHKPDSIEFMILDEDGNTLRKHDVSRISETILLNNNSIIVDENQFKYRNIKRFNREGYLIWEKEFDASYKIYDDINNKGLYIYSDVLYNVKKIDAEGNVDFTSQFKPYKIFEDEDGNTLFLYFKEKSNQLTFLKVNSKGRIQWSNELKNEIYFIGSFQNDTVYMNWEGNIAYLSILNKDGDSVYKKQIIGTQVMDAQTIEIYTLSNKSDNLKVEKISIHSNYIDEIRQNLY